MRYRLIAGMLACFLALPVTAEQTIIPNYNSARDTYFWDQLYLFGGWTLYCGSPFYEKGRGMQVEHIYPASWIAEHMGCGSRTECRDAPDEQIKTRFNHIEGDLHNLFPAMTWANNRRSNKPFGLLFGEHWYFEDCDFEMGYRARDGAEIIEPRPEARGEIARAIFYMHQEYGLPIDPPLGEMLKQWNRNDPPSWDEVRRNKKINQLQGTKNIFITDPSLGDELEF